jgi:hypothetical protein
LAAFRGSRHFMGEFRSYMAILSIREGWGPYQTTSLFSLLRVRQIASNCFLRLVKAPVPPEHDVRPRSPNAFPNVLCAACSNLHNVSSASLLVLLILLMTADRYVNVLLEIIVFTLPIIPTFLLCPSYLRSKVLLSGRVTCLYGAPPSPFEMCSPTLAMRMQTSQPSLLTTRAPYFLVLFPWIDLMLTLLGPCLPQLGVSMPHEAIQLGL